MGSRVAAEDVLLLVDVVVLLAEVVVILLEVPEVLEVVGADVIVLDDVFVEVVVDDVELAGDVVVAVDDFAELDDDVERLAGVGELLVGVID